MATIKSQLALQANVEAYGRYFWTFTVRDEIPATVFCEMWSKLRADLVRIMGFRGIRVFEIHPQGHGLHVHVVTPQFYSVDAVRILADRRGWGRLHVVRIRGRNRRRISNYLCKYLCKSMRSLSINYLTGMRIWGSFGKIASSKRYLVKDIFVRSRFNDFYRFCRDRFYWLPMSFFGLSLERDRVRYQWRFLCSVVRSWYTSGTSFDFMRQAFADFLGVGFEDVYQ